MVQYKSRFSQKKSLYHFLPYLVNVLQIAADEKTTCSGGTGCTHRVNYFVVGTGGNSADDSITLSLDDLGQLVPGYHKQGSPKPYGQTYTIWRFWTSNLREKTVKFFSMAASGSTIRSSLRSSSTDVFCADLAEWAALPSEVPDLASRSLSSLRILSFS